MISPASQQATQQSITAFFQHDKPAVIGLMAACVIAIIILGRRSGDTVPVLACLAAGLFMIFVVPHVPGSPIACLAVPGGACNRGHQETWLFGLVFIVPLGVMAVLSRGLRRRGRL